MLHVIIISINSHNSLCIILDVICKIYFLVLGYSNFDENFNKLANSFWFYDTIFYIWIKNALGIKSEHQNGKGTKKVNVFHNMWRLNSMEMGTIIY
jgi:hypothetical protein